MKTGETEKVENIVVNLIDANMLLPTNRPTGNQHDVNQETRNPENLVNCEVSYRELLLFALHTVF